MFSLDKDFETTISMIVGYRMSIFIKDLINEFIEIHKSIALIYFFHTEFKNSDYINEPVRDSLLHFNLFSKYNDNFENKIFLIRFIKGSKNNRNIIHITKTNLSNNDLDYIKSFNLENLWINPFFD
ncbi:MAG: hypothetical protein ACFFG0_07575 [Candidatus Thorarchaeota archaeon]